MTSPTLQSLTEQAKQLSASDKLALAEALIAMVRREAATPAPSCAADEGHHAFGLCAEEEAIWRLNEFEAHAEGDGTGNL